MQAAPINDLDADYTPRYIWLAKLLRGWIEDGTYSPGSLLPSSARLAAVHGVSRATALHALAILIKSGHVRHVGSKPQVIWRPGAAATAQASFPGSAGGSHSLPALCPSQDLQHGRKAFDQRGKQFLSFLRGSQRGPAYHAALRVFTQSGSEKMTPVICCPVRSLVAISDEFGLRVKQDSGLKLTSVHILVVRRGEPCRIPGIRPVRPGREKRRALAVGISFLDNVSQDVITLMAIHDDQ